MRGGTVTWMVSVPTRAAPYQDPCSKEIRAPQEHQPKCGVIGQAGRAKWRGTETAGGRRARQKDLARQSRGLEEKVEEAFGEALHTLRSGSASHDSIQEWSSGRELTQWKSGSSE